MNLRLSEPLIEAVKQKLIDNMPGRLAVINNDPNLPTIAPIGEPQAFYTAPLNPMPPAMPAVIVTDGNMTIAPETEGPHSFISDWAIAVLVVDENADRQILGKRLQRLTRAVMESLWDSDPKEMVNLADGSNEAFRVFPSGVIPGPMLTEPDRPDVTRSFYTSVFSCRLLEE